MPLLKERRVKQARKWYSCDGCGRMIKQGSSYTYLYGSAHVGEKPYVLRICPKCQTEFDRMVKNS